MMQRTLQIMLILVYKALLYTMLANLLFACNISYQREPDLDGTLERLYGINDALELCSRQVLEHNDILWKEMEKLRAIQGEQASKDWIQLAMTIRADRKKIIAFTKEMREKITQLSGGYGVNGKLIGAKDHRYHTAYTLGNQDNGSAYELYAMLNEFQELLQKKLPEMDRHPVLEYDQTQALSDDFSHHYFGEMPALTCIAVLHQCDTEILQLEQEALIEILQIQGGTCCGIIYHQ